MKFKLLILIFVVSFTGCAAPPRSGFSSEFKRTLNSTSHGYNVIKDPTGSAPTEYVERFEVRPGDCSQDSIWSDCKNARERSMIKSNIGSFLGHEEKYSLYMFVPEDWKDINPASNMYVQFYQPHKPGIDGYGQALFGVMLTERGLYIENFIKFYKKSPTYDIKELKGKWTKIEIHVKWMDDSDDGNSDGFYKIYINGNLFDEFHGNTASRYGNDEMLFVYGNYRFFLNLVTFPLPTQVVYYANVKRERIK
jgi:Polysaccharide lyase